MVSLAEGFAVSFWHRNLLQHTKHLSQTDTVTHAPVKPFCLSSVPKKWFTSYSSEVAQPLAHNQLIVDNG